MKDAHDRIRASKIKDFKYYNYYLYALSLRLFKGSHNSPNPDSDSAPVYLDSAYYALAHRYGLENYSSWPDFIIGSMTLSEIDDLSKVWQNFDDTCHITYKSRYSTSENRMLSQFAKAVSKTAELTSAAMKRAGNHTVSGTGLVRRHLDHIFDLVQELSHLKAQADNLAPNDRCSSDVPHMGCCEYHSCTQQINRAEINLTDQWHSPKCGSEIEARSGFDPSVLYFICPSGTAYPMLLSHSSYAQAIIGEATHIGDSPKAEDLSPLPHVPKEAADLISSLHWDTLLSYWSDQSIREGVFFYQSYPPIDDARREFANF